VGMWRIEQDDFYQKYDTEDKSVQVTPPTLNIVSVTSVPDSLKLRMVKLK